MGNRTYSPAKLAVGVIAGALMSTAAQADPLKLKHTVYLGGLYMGSASTEIEQTDNSYVMQTKADTNENMRWMFEWIAKGASQGDVLGADVFPKLHSHVSQWRDKQRGVDITYSPTGNVDYKVIGKKNSNTKKYTPIDPGSVHKSMDPMSMIFAAILQFEEAGKCQGVYPVFDGRRRYDVILQDAGTRSFKRSDYSVFSGEARGCAFEIEEKGGFKRSKDYNVDEMGEMIVWVGTPVSGGRMVPVRMQVITGFGTLELHLDKYNQGNVKLASKVSD